MADSFKAAAAEMNIFDAIRSGNDDPVQPVRLRPEDSFCFSCHPDVPCWNACCAGADISLTPLDILNLSRHFGIRPAEFLERHAVPAMWEQADLPIAKLRMEGADGQGKCPFLAGDAGCGVYAARPATCRYYPLGLASVKMKGAEERDDFYFLVKESHCKGHQQDNHQTVAHYRAEQGLEPYDKVNRGWIDILMKMISWKSVGGPLGKGVNRQTKKMFFMVSTDVDAFRRFVMESKFLTTYSVDPEMVERLKTDDEILLCLGFDWLKNLLFNEPTIMMKKDVIQGAIAKARTEFGAA